jgi:hypothetical protein
LSLDWGHLIINHLDSEWITTINAKNWGADLLRSNWKFILKTRKFGFVEKIQHQGPTNMGLWGSSHHEKKQSNYEKTN